MLDHAALWTAIDRLAARAGISVSALARRAGLDPTSFNLSKRTVGKRPRWPSTENLMQVLRVTDTSIHDFAALAGDGASPTFKVPLLQDTAAAPLLLELPGFDDPRLCALVVAARHGPGPYRRGTILLLRPAAKPRLGTMVVLKTRTNKIRIGVVRRHGGGIMHLAGNGAKTEKIARDDIIGCFPVIWASQSPL